MKEKDLQKELNEISEQNQPEVCGINSSIHSADQINSESLEEKLDKISEESAPQVCGIDSAVHSAAQIKETDNNLQEELNNIASKEEPEVCGINSSVHSAAQIKETDNNLAEALDKITASEEPEVCGINSSVHSAAQIKETDNNLAEALDKITASEEPEVCGINSSVHSAQQIASNSLQAKLDKIADESSPEVCGIDKNVSSTGSPEVCSINTEGKPQKLSIRTDKENLEHENIADTYGVNVPATPEERAALLAGFKKQAEAEEKAAPKTETDEPVITVIKNGPYIVKGDVPVYDAGIKIDAKGQSIGWQDVKDLGDRQVVVLCRCGRSKHMPFCDQTHVHIHFDGTCTASNEPYDEAANIYRGCQDVYLMDEVSLCAILRFCDPDGSCWNLIKSEDTVDIAQEESFNCASGRLTLVKDGKKIEPKLDKEIEAIYDTERDVLGPLWVKGGIPVKTDKVDYEVRNRQTLCRCGRSYNKPFCDGMHLTCPKLSEEEAKENE